MNKKRYIRLLSVILLLVTTLTFGWSYFTDYKISQIKTEGGVSLEVQGDDGISKVSQSGYRVQKGGIGWYKNGDSATVTADVRNGYTFSGWYNGNSKVSSNISHSFSVTEPTVLIAKTSVTNYAITAELDGGTINGSTTWSKTYTVKDSVTLPTPTKVGHTFLGWVEKGGNAVPNPNYTIPVGSTGNKTFVAKWRPNKVTIYYHSNGAKMNTSMAGSEYSVDTDGYVTRGGKRFYYDASYGSYVAGSSTNSIPDVQSKGALYLEKQGYHYSGSEAWNTRSDGNGRSVDENRGYLAEELADLKNGDATITLYANWKKSSYTLTYNANGGTVSTSSKTLQYGDAFGTLPTPKRDGHKFLGWYTSATEGTKVSETTKIGAENTTIYAHWDAYTLGINYHADGAQSFKDLDLETGKELGDISVSGKDVFKTYTMTYTDKLPSFGVADVDRLKKEGYSLSGDDSSHWYIKDKSGVLSIAVNDDRVDYTAIQLATLAGKQTDFKTGNITIDLYPKWTINKYSNKVEHWAWGFGNQEGNNGNKEAYKIDTTYFDAVFNTTFIVDKSKQTTLPKGFHLQNTFGTSAIDGTWQTYPLGTKVTQGAKSLGFEYDYYPTTYKIAYNLNGGTNNSDNPSSYNVLYGVSLKNPTRQGYTFSGWYNGGTKATGINEGKGANFTSSAELYSELKKRTIGDVTLEAHWTPTKYTLSFDPNGGTVNPTSKTVSYGSPYGDLPTPTKSGNTFLGWFTEKDGGTQVSSTTTMGASNVTLYAHWKLDIRDTVLGDRSVFSRTFGQYIKNNSYIYSIEIGTEGSGSLEATYDVSQNQDNSIKARVYRQNYMYYTISIMPETGYRMVAPDNCVLWFAWDATDLSRIQSISISQVDFKNTRNMSHMFNYCGIRDVTLRGINNKNIVMNGMFEGCDSLQSITVDSLWRFDSSIGLDGIWTNGGIDYGGNTLPSYRDATYYKSTSYVYLETGVKLRSELSSLVTSYPSKVAIVFGTPSGGLFGNAIDVSESKDGSVLMNWGYSGGSMSSGVIYIYPSDSTKKIALNTESRGMFDSLYNNVPITVDFGTNAVTDVLTRNTSTSLVWHTSSDLKYTGDDICGLVSNQNNRSIQLQSDDVDNEQVTQPDVDTPDSTVGTDTPDTQKDTDTTDSQKGTDISDESLDIDTPDVQEDTNTEVTDSNDVLHEESNQVGGIEEVIE